MYFLIGLIVVCQETVEVRRLNTPRRFRRSEKVLVQIAIVGLGNEFDRIARGDRPSALGEAPLEKSLCEIAQILLQITRIQARPVKSVTIKCRI